MKSIAVLLLLSCALSAQKVPFQLPPIEKLKGIESSHFDSSLPTLFFGKWFKRLVHPAVPNYEPRDCESATAAPKPGAAKQQCFYVWAAVPPERTVALTFRLNTASNSFDYVEGSIGPSDPKSKQPTRKITKLSELPALVHPEGQ